MERRLVALKARGPRLLWIVLVVNVVIVLTAIVIGTTLCRKGGAEPYNKLPSEYCLSTR